MSKGSNDERDNEIIVSFAKRPQNASVASDDKSVTAEGKNTNSTSSKREMVARWLQPNF